MYVNFVDALRDATHDALRESLRRHMPAGPLRDYYLWGLDPAHPEHPRFLRAAGIAQLTNLYAALADGLVQDTNTEVAGLLARIAAYQTYEIISDNLATGLFPPPCEAPAGRPGPSRRRAAPRPERTERPVPAQRGAVALPEPPPPGRPSLDQVPTEGTSFEQPPTPGQATPGQATPGQQRGPATGWERVPVQPGPAAERGSAPGPAGPARKSEPAHAPLGLATEPEPGFGSLALSAEQRADAARRRLLRTFNAAMTVRLGGCGRTAAVILGPERGQANRIDSLRHGLSTETHRELVASGAAGGRSADVRWDLWPALVANIESGAAVAAAVADTPLGGLVRDGLAERYRAVSRTLSDRHLSRLELGAVGAHSVLVVPTLAYCIAAVTELDGRLPGLAATVADGTLPEALHDAALLSRLLNDAGTGLLRLGRPARREALRLLRARVTTRGLAGSLRGPLFTRLAKDVTHGEFNICLYGARRAGDRATAMDAIEADLDYFAQLYTLHRGRLSRALRNLTARLDDRRPAILIERFLNFHTQLYAQSYQDPTGEYAL